MSSFNDRLYKLIPAIYRIRDEESDGPLRALLSVVSEQVDVIQRDMEQLYDNWFIETCDEWVVPYIGELVGHKPVVPSTGEITDPHIQARNRWLFPRREIANIVRYRRRKGTLPVLEEIALDTAGWHAMAVEFRKQVAATPNLRFGDQDSAPNLPNFRESEQADYFGGPFNTVGHTVNFRALQAAERRMTEGAGNARETHSSLGLPIGPRSVGLWVWRNGVDSITGVTPGCRVYCGTRYFTFHPLGMDTPLYNLPKKPKDREELALQSELPIQLTRTLLATGKEAHPDKNYYAAGRSLVIRVRGDQACRLGLPHGDGDTFVEIPAKAIWVGSLGNSIIASLTLEKFPAGIEAILDPERGRFVVKCALQAPACEHDFSADMFQVTYHHSVGGNLGGGEYYRDRDPKRKLATWVVTPTKLPVRTDVRCPATSPALPLDPERDSASIDQAFDLLSTRLTLIANPDTPADQRHLILELAESGVYWIKERLALTIPRDVTVELRAAARVCPFLIPASRSTCGELPLKFELHPGARLVIDGLIIDAEGICVTHIAEPVESKPATDAAGADSLGVNAIKLPQPSRVLLRHATLVPRSCHCSCDNADQEKSGRLIIGPGVGEVCLDHAVTGPIEMCGCASCGAGCSVECQCHKHCPPPATNLRVHDSIVDGQGEQGIEGTRKDAPAVLPPLVSAFEQLAFGRPKFAALNLTFGLAAISHSPASSGFHLEAARSTFLGSVCIRSLSTMSNCICTGVLCVERTQSGIVRFSHAPGAREIQPPRLRCLPDLEQGTDSVLHDAIESLRYGEPGYCQLRRTASWECRRGADDGGEMGVFHDQFISHRELALERRLAEFTPATHTLNILYAEDIRVTPVEDK